MADNENKGVRQKECRVMNCEAKGRTEDGSGGRNKCESRWGTGEWTGRKSSVGGRKGLLEVT